jgi:hypothetical protein
MAIVATQKTLRRESPDCGHHTPGEKILKGLFPEKGELETRQR